MRAHALHEAGEVLGQARARAGDAAEGDTVEKASTCLARDPRHPLDARVRAGRRDEKDQLDARSGRGVAQWLRLLRRQVGHDQPRDAGLARTAAEALDSVAVEWIVLA